MTALVYAAVILVLIGTVVAVLVLLGKVRKRHEMQALRAVMRQVLDDEPEKPGYEDS